MRRVSISFPPEVVQALDRARGSSSRSQFARRLLTRALKQHEEREYKRITTEVYGDATFAEEEERLAEDFMRESPSPDD